MSSAQSTLPKSSSAKQKQPSFGQALWKSMKKFPMVYVGSFIIIVLVLMAVFAPWIATHPPNIQYNNGITNGGTPQAPNHEFIFGADDLGRDVFSRMVYGSRVSLEVGVAAAVISLFVGTILGLISGYFGGFIDSLIMRITDAVLAFPTLLFVLALVAILRPSISNIFIAIGILGWGTTARIVRASVLSVKQFEYVQAARAMGASSFRILFRTILPNVLGPVIVTTALSVGGNILTEASLSFLGAGIPQPTASWGNMIQEGLTTFTYAPWMVIVPGVALMIAVLGFNLLGDGLRDILDPRNQSH